MEILVMGLSRIHLLWIAFHPSWASWHQLCSVSPQFCLIDSSALSLLPLRLRICSSNSSSLTASWLATTLLVFLQQTATKKIWKSTHSWIGSDTILSVAALGSGVYWDRRRIIIVKREKKKRRREEELRRIE